MKGNIQRVNKHIKKSLASLIIRKAPVKTKLTPLHTHWLTLESQTISNAGEEQLELLSIERRNLNIYNFGKPLWQFRIQLYIYLPDDPTISLLYISC